MSLNLKISLFNDYIDMDSELMYHSSDDDDDETKEKSL